MDSALPSSASVRVSSQSLVHILGARVAVDLPTDSNDEDRCRTVRRALSELVWCSYRAGIAPLGSSGMRTDAGWGCMLRAGQMLFANALVRHFGGSRAAALRRVLPLFDDSVDDPLAAPFAVQQIARAGERYGTALGQWFGPQVLCAALRDLARDRDAVADQLAVYLARDGVIYRDELEAACGARRQSCLILVPQRLGLNHVSHTYVAQIRRALESPYSCGIAGGRSNGARFFCGLVSDPGRDDAVLYLDPHVVQATVAMRNAANFDDRSFHCDAPGSMALHDIDPSVSFAFYCRDAVEREALLASIGATICRGTVDTFDAPAISVVSSLPDYLCEDAQDAPSRLMLFEDGEEEEKEKSGRSDMDDDDDDFAEL